MTDLPVVITTAGLQPQTPAELRALLVAGVASTNPGYTADLPGALVEDLASTEVGALVICDSAKVETVNSLTPLGANAFTLLQLGQIYIGPGTMPGIPTNTSVYVVFSDPDAPGQTVNAGFIVSDGTFQYTVQDGGILGSDGNSDPLFCLATIPGTWAVPTNTVNQLVTSAPPGVSLTCTNQQPGTPGGDAETEEEWRARVLTAGQAVSQGMTTRLKTALKKVPGVQQRLISVRQQPDGWTVICGGGDPYKVAYAIEAALFDISSLVGSVLRVTSITQANPGVVTTDLNHGYSNGQRAVISDVVGMTPINGLPFSAVVVDEKTFSINAPVPLTSLAWGSTAGGQITGSTAEPHGVAPGGEFTISGALPDGYDGTFTALAGTAGNTVVYALAADPGTETVPGQMLVGISTIPYPAYVSGGEVSPNLRNVTPNIYDYPDIYTVRFVNPPLQTVTVAVTYNTTAPNFVSQAAVAQLSAPAIQAYVNSIGAGQPMSALLLEKAFLDAVVSVLASTQVSVLNFAVSINGISTPPETGTKIIVGDPESYFFAELSGVTVAQS